MAKKIGVIGATGMAGSAITSAALEHGLTVRAFIRNEQKARDLFDDKVDYVTKDVFDLTSSDIADLDVVVDAFSPGHDPSKAHQHVELAQHLLDLVRGSETPRLFFILGAANLGIGNGKRLIDRLETMPNKETFIHTPRAQVEEYQLLLDSEGVNWVAVSPSGTFKPGEPADYELGTDQLMHNATGKSEITSGTMGQVIVNEILSPAHQNERFTAIDK